MTMLASAVCAYTGPNQGVQELGFHLRLNYWGQGLALEAAKAAIDFAFSVIGAKGVSAGHHPENLNSKKVLEKLGFQYTHDEFFSELGMCIPYYMVRPVWCPVMPIDEVPAR
jgi:[ribosomal protein S5]-alanine N-acetyltransferase